MNRITRAEREELTEAADAVRAFAFNVVEELLLYSAEDAGRVAAQVEAVVVAGLTAILIDEEPGDVIRRLRTELAALATRQNDAEAELAAALIAAGRRPGDESDQAALFDTREPDLFTEAELAAAMQG